MRSAPLRLLVRAANGVYVSLLGGSAEDVGVEEGNDLVQRRLHVVRCRAVHAGVHQREQRRAQHVRHETSVQPVGKELDDLG